jgi:putative Mn2+ efflux pump MntP
MNDIPGKVLIPFAYIACAFFNVYFYLSKFMSETSTFWLNAYAEIRAHWALFMFLNFLGVASLTVDHIVKYDKINKPKRTILSVLTVTLLVAFFTQIVWGMLEIYITGEIN